jgi:hypothetical protein
MDNFVGRRRRQLQSQSSDSEESSENDFSANEFATSKPRRTKPARAGMNPRELMKVAATYEISLLKLKVFNLFLNDS